MTQFQDLLGLLTSSPLCLVAILSAVALMVVNGWTDAPVNIATSIHSGAIGVKGAVILSALCNLLGAVTLGLVGNSVAASVYNISGLANIGANALTALTASFIAVVLWALLAMRYGLPTSESHALMSALSGSAVAVQGVSALNGGEWLKALCGIALSTIPLVFLGVAVAKFFEKQLNLPETTFKKLQVLGAALSSFSHGAQDGQKLAGALFLTAILCQDNKPTSAKVPMWAVLTAGAVISIGTLFGGRKIIKKFKTFAPTNPKLGFCSDMVSAVGLVLLAGVGLPASTTHAKSSAVLGAGLGEKSLTDQLKSFRSMVVVWVLTFPVSATLGFLITKILC